MHYPSKSEKSLLHTPDTSLAQLSQVPPSVREVLRLPAQPLDPATRAFMEPRFGRDFSGVRVHTDVRAAETARAVNALAYTVGEDVVFGAGQYAPGLTRGRRLLAHELTHVVQQGAARQSSVQIERSDSEAEHQAHSVATQVISGREAVGMGSARPGTLQREEGDEERAARWSYRCRGFVWRNRCWERAWDPLCAPPSASIYRHFSSIPRSRHRSEPSNICTV